VFNKKEVILMKKEKLDPVQTIESYAVIIRAIHCRGQDQRDALEELDRRRLWLSHEQKISAGLEQEQ